MIEKSLKTDTGPQLVPGEERRRSQRVLIRTAVTLRYVSQGTHVNVPAHTISVNDHGAMIVAGRDLPVGNLLEIENMRTGQIQPCRITRPARETPEGLQIPVEFDAPAPGFWHICFPPAV